MNGAAGTNFQPPPPPPLSAGDPMSSIVVRLYSSIVPGMDHDCLDLLWLADFSLLQAHLLEGEVDW